MIIYRSIDEIREQLPNAVVTIGNFDGVHLGHREMFRRLKKAAADMGGVSVVITFSPHPLKVLPVGRDVRLINTYAEKEHLIEASGVDYLVVLPFTPEFASITATDFVRDILVGRIGARKLIIGYDYAFGRNREGDVAFLQRLGRDMGFSVEVLAPIGTGETVYSSSMVRRLILEGNVKDVVSLLGRHFSLAGTVVHGHNRGKDIGFPTANLATDKELIPAFGVYAVKVKVDDHIYDGACNIGDNPTFDDTARSIEVFVFDFDGDLYGKELRLYFVERLRGEKKFTDVASLAQAIGDDIRRCRDILRDVSVIAYRDYLGADDNG